MEVCPVIIVPYAPVGAESNLYDFIFHKNRHEGLLPFGFGCLYNHSDDPNLDWQFAPSRMAVRLIAKKSITPDAELTLDYNYEKKYWNDHPWYYRLQEAKCSASK